MGADVLAQPPEVPAAGCAALPPPRRSRWSAAPVAAPAAFTQSFGRSPTVVSRHTTPADRDAARRLRDLPTARASDPPSSSTCGDNHLHRFLSAHLESGGAKPALYAARSLRRGVSVDRSGVGRSLSPAVGSKRFGPGRSRLAATGDGTGGSRRGDRFHRGRRWFLKGQVEARLSLGGGHNAGRGCDIRPDGSGRGGGAGRLLQLDFGVHARPARHSGAMAANGD